MNRQTSFARWVSLQRDKYSNTNERNKQWVHPADALLRGHIVYTVKNLGSCEVDDPKGTEVVKTAIRKMKFNKQIKKAEGIKSHKIELTISIDGVSIQEPRSKITHYSYPLHRISYCADDKSDKKMLTFIAKAADSDQHFCHVFSSDRSAEEITLTIGQAFDMAYKRFIETSGQNMEMKKQYLMMQKRIHTLEMENAKLKKKLQDCELNHGTTKQNVEQKSEVGRKLENLLLDDIFVPEEATLNNAEQQNILNNSLISITPPPSKKLQNGTGSDHETGVTSVKGYDPFGMGTFIPANSQDLDSAIFNVDNALLDLQSGFGQGLSFGTSDFKVDDVSKDFLK